METTAPKTYVMKTFCTSEGKDLLTPKIRDIRTLFQVDVLIESVGNGVILCAKNPTNFYRYNFMDYFRNVISPQHVLQFNHVEFPNKKIFDVFRGIEKEYGVVVIYNSIEKILRIQGNTQPWSTFKENLSKVFGMNWEYYSQSRDSWVSLGEEAQTIFNANFCNREFFVIDNGDGAEIQVNLDDMEVTDDKGFLRRLRLSIFPRMDPVTDSSPPGDLVSTYAASLGVPPSSPSKYGSGEPCPAFEKKSSASPTPKPKASVADEGESSTKGGKKPSASPTLKPKVSVADEGESSTGGGKKPSVSPTPKPKASVVDEGESSTKGGKKPSASSSPKPKASVADEGESSTGGGKKDARFPIRHESPIVVIRRPVHPNIKPHPGGLPVRLTSSESTKWNLFAQFPSLSKVPLRSVIIEGTNAALACGGKTYFNAKGLALMCEYFSSCGVEVVISLPNYRTNDVPHKPPTMDIDGDINKLLEENRFLVIPGNMDEHLAVLEYAHLTQSVIISNYTKVERFPPHLAAYSKGKIFTFVITDNSITITRQMFKKFDFTKAMLR